MRLGTVSGCPPGPRVFNLMSGNEHHRMNVFFSRLDEQQRRWYAALEARRLGHGGATPVSQITGIHIDTIRRGLRELEKDLEGRPVDRVRLPGGGRKRIEEKTPTIV